MKAKDKMKKVIKWVVIGFIILMVLGAIGASKDSGTASQPVGDTIVSNTLTTVPTDVPQATDVPQPTATEIPVTPINISTLFEYYDANKIVAQAHYKDSIIQVTGVATNISQDILGNYFVALGPGGDNFSMDQVECYVSGPDQLTSISNGRTVTVQGRVDDMSLGIIPLKDCTVVS